MRIKRRPRLVCYPALDALPCRVCCYRSQGVFHAGCHSGVVCGNVRLFSLDSAAALEAETSGANVGATDRLVTCCSLVVHQLFCLRIGHRRDQQHDLRFVLFQTCSVERLIINSPSHQEIAVARLHQHLPGCLYPGERLLRVWGL